MSEDPYKQFKSDCAEEVRRQGLNPQLSTATKEWFGLANAEKYSYHFEWLGRPIIQYPQDMVAIQELIWEVRPDLIIETGIAHGGSLILSASMLAMLDLCDAIESGSMMDPRRSARRVLGIDIDIRSHNREAILAHPMSSRISMIEGSSISEGVVEQVRDVASKYKTVLVFLDSNHTHAHVLAELAAYAPLVSIGSYCVVFDTVIAHMPAEQSSNRPWGPSDNPLTAVQSYLESDDCFEVQTDIDSRLLVTVAPGGYLRRVR